MRRRALLWLVGLWLVGSALAWPLVGQEATRLEPAAAQHEALREIVRRDAVQTLPERPGFSAYMADLGSALLDSLAQRLEKYVPGIFEALASFATVAAQVIFIVALLLLAALVLRAILDDVRRRRRLAGQDPPVVPVEASGQDDTGGRSREDWAEELAKRLAAGDVTAACEALWWWLARGLADNDAEEAWTSRELLAHAGRFDLTAPVRRLDRMIYGASRPSTEDVHGLWNELREGVG